MKKKFLTLPFLKLLKNHYDNNGIVGQFRGAGIGILSRQQGFQGDQRIEMFPYLTIEPMIEQERLETNVSIYVDVIFRVGVAHSDTDLIEPLINDVIENTSGRDDGLIPPGEDGVFLDDVKLYSLNCLDGDLQWFEKPGYWVAWQEYRAMLSMPK